MRQLGATMPKSAAFAPVIVYSLFHIVPGSTGKTEQEKRLS